MGTLEKRVVKLEETAGPADPLRMVVRFIAPGCDPSPIERLAADGQEWTRAAGEDEAAFIERASSQANQPQGCALVLFVQ